MATEGRSAGDSDESMNNATEQSPAPGQGTPSAPVAPARERGTVVDVFCGAGGLSHGFMLEGFDVRAGIDIDASCRHAYEHNNETVRDAIAGLPPIAAGKSAADDPLHRASRLSAVNLARIQAAKPGQTWRDWDASLVADCHRKDSGRWYQSVYGRMSWEAPAPTITTRCNGFGNGRFGHPEQDRAISLREAALLQTFPRDYQFFAPDECWTISTTARSIGNAVPVALARAVARSVARTLDGKHDG